MISLIDTHAHLDAPELSGRGFDLLEPAVAKGIEKFVVPGVRVSCWQPLMQAVEQHVEVYAAPGLHPAYADQWSGTAQRQLAELTSHEKVVAIGEVGLDGVYGPSLDVQEKVLRDQLQIALDAGLPVLLHGRKATGHLLDILRELQVGPQVGGVWHGFSASLQVAEELVRLGFKIGVGPILLRQSARKLPQAVIDLPTEALVLETDLPDMAENPVTLIAVAEKVAELRGCALEEVARFTNENVSSVFGI